MKTKTIQVPNNNLLDLMSDSPPPLNVPCLVHLGDRKNSVWMVGEHRKIGSKVAFRADFTGGMGWPVPTERAKRDYGSFHLWVVLPNTNAADIKKEANQ